MDITQMEISYTDKSAKIYDLSKDFSGKQGQNGWFYLCWDGSGYSALEYDTKKSEWTDGENAVGRGGISPAGEKSACVFAWTAPREGRVCIAGRIENLHYGKNTEGSEAVIYHNGEKIWPVFETQRLLGGYSINHSLTCDVKEGDTIYFRLNALSEDAKNAKTRWLPVITYDHEPAVILGGTKLIMDPDEYKRIGLTFTDGQFGIVPKGETNDYYCNWADQVFKFNGPPENPTKDKIYMQYEYDFPNPTGASGRWWITNIYVDDRSAEGKPDGLLAFCHIEFGLDGRAWGISLMYSEDDGQTWVKLGVIVEQEYDNPMTVNIMGTPYIIKDGYFYIYYADYNGVESSVAAASAKVSEVLAAAREKRVCEWKKYHNGSFCEPGLRGRFSRIIDPGEWTVDDWGFHGDAAYSTYLEKYVMTGYNHGKKSGYWLSFSDDGIHWSAREWIQEYDRSGRAENVLSPYQTIMASDGTDNGVVGRDFYIYAASYRDWKFPNGDLCYLYITKVSTNKKAVELLQEQTPVRDKTRAKWGSAEDFSETQGKNDWFYMSGNGTLLYYMGYDENAGIYGGAGSIGAKTQSTPAANEYFSARVWSAPRAGIVRVSGSIKKEDPAGAGEAEVKISLKNRQLLPERGRKTIAGKDEIAFDFTVGVFDYDALIFEAANPDVSSNPQVSLIFDITIEYIGGPGADIPLSPLYDLVNETISAEMAFSGTQGGGGFSYRTWDGKKYGALDWNPADARWEIKNTFTIVGNNWQHPDSLDSVRTWTAPMDGTVLVASAVKCGSYKDGGDGILASVRKNEEIAWEKTPVGSAEENETVDCTFRVEVKEGDTINFIVNKNKSAVYDTTTWAPVIKYVG